MKRFGNQKGVALVIVLGAILILTTMAVEFALNARISYNLAAYQRDRLRATYLARSALQFGKLELQMEKEVRRRFGSQLQQFGISPQPLCQQIPFDTRLFRGMLEGEEPAARESATQEPTAPETAPVTQEGGSQEASLPVSPSQFVSFIDREKAQSFLGFSGDFGLLCQSEDSKINVNYFWEAANTASQSELNSNRYETHKNLLIQLFSGSTFESIFSGHRDEISRLVQRIADWVDRNDRINEAPGIEGGLEQNEYSGSEYDYRVKNGKMASLSELLLISGFGDDLFKKASPYLTVYGDDRINVCTCEEPVLQALIAQYGQSLSPPVQVTDQDLMTQTLAAIGESCSLGKSKPRDILLVIQNSLGIPQSPDTLEAQKRFEVRLTDESRYYYFELTGESGDVSVLVKTVLDTKGDVSQWKQVYYRVQ